MNADSRSLQSKLRLIKMEDLTGFGKTFQKFFWSISLSYLLAGIMQILQENQF